MEEAHLLVVAGISFILGGLAGDWIQWVRTRSAPKESTPKIENLVTNTVILTIGLALIIHGHWFTT